MENSIAEFAKPTNATMSQLTIDAYNRFIMEWNGIA
jgi:hypothetical protein